jgi:hypothetical protein
MTRVRFPSPLQFFQALAAQVLNSARPEQTADICQNEQQHPCQNGWTSTTYRHHRAHDFGPLHKVTTGLNNLHRSGHAGNLS